MEEILRRLASESHGVALVLLLMVLGLGVAVGRLWQAYRRLQEELLLERLRSLERELEEIKQILMRRR